MTPARKLVAEALGTLLLTSAVLGSGIMAQQLAHDPALALLCNTLATGAALITLLLMFGPISGAHLNPAVTVVMATTRDLSPRLAAGYIAVQIGAAIAGAVEDALAPLGVQVSSTRLQPHHVRALVRATGWEPDAAAFAGLEQP